MEPLPCCRQWRCTDSTWMCTAGVSGTCWVIASWRKEITEKALIMSKQPWAKIHMRSGQFCQNDQLARRRNIGLLYSFYVSSYLWKPLLAPARADDESYQLSLLKPTQRQLRALTQEVKHFIQSKWTLSRHRDKCWGCKEKQLIQWVMSWESRWWRLEKEMCCTQVKTGTYTIFNIKTIFKRFIATPMTEWTTQNCIFTCRMPFKFLPFWYKGLKQVKCILFVSSRRLIYLLSLSQTHWWHPVAWGFWTRWQGACVVSVAGDWRVSSERRAWRTVSRWPAVSWCLNNTRIGSEYLSEVFCPLLFLAFCNRNVLLMLSMMQSNPASQTFWVCPTALTVMWLTSEGKVLTCVSLQLSPPPAPLCLWSQTVKWSSQSRIAGWTRVSKVSKSPVLTWQTFCSWGISCTICMFLNIPDTNTPHTDN